MKELKTLSDHPSFENGNTQIYYTKTNAYRRISAAAYANDNADVTLKTLNHTHSLLGNIAQTSLPEIYTLLQWDNWSPNGEGRALLKTKGLTHTSMSHGDIAVVEGIAYILMTKGFEKLPEA